MRVFRVVRAILREVFEESAYERFCTREGMSMGRESYAKFLSENNAAKQHKVRCC